MNTSHSARDAFRALVRRPGLALLIIAMLAVGIASVTVMFALFEAVLLRGLPFHETDRLVHVWGHPADPALGGSADSRWWTSYADLEDLRRDQTRFQALAGYVAVNIVVQTDELRPRRLDAARVGAGFFELLGVSPRQGRFFDAAENTWGGEPVVVLRHDLARELGIQPAEIGQATVVLDGVSHRVIGIVDQAQLPFPRGARFWMPLAQNAARDNRGQHRLKVVGRLAPQASPETAAAELTGLTAGLAEQYPDTNLNRSAWVEPLETSLTGAYAPIMTLLLGACGVLMLVVAVNVAGLLMVSAIRRRREVAIRCSLGASRRRLAGQFLTEAILLGIFAALVALALAWIALQSAGAWLPADVPYAERAGINPSVFGLALATGLLAAILFGLVPALRGARSAAANDLKPGAAEVGSDRAGFGVGGALLITQVALAFTLVTVAAGLLGRAHELMAEPLGFDAEGRLALRIYLPAVDYHPMEAPLKVNAYYRRLLEEVRATPGVLAAAVGAVHPLEPNWTTSYWIEGRDPPANGLLPEARFRPVGPDYFRTAGIPLLAGRGIEAGDDFDAAGVVVINQAFARLHFDGMDPVGAYLTKQGWWQERDSTRWRIVGVAGDVRFDGPARPAAPALYFSQAQWPLEDRYLLVQASGDPALLVRPIQEIIWSIDPAVPADAMTFLERARAELLRERLAATALVSLFAVIVVLLALAGLYSVMSFAVGRERRQIGVRLAVGATPVSILVRYLRRGLVLVAVGALLGVSLQLLLEPLLAAASIGPGGVALLASAALFLAAGLLGAALPARRAAHLSPMDVLRDE